MNNDSMIINLWAPIFSGKDDEWPEFIVKFEAFFSDEGMH